MPPKPPRRTLERILQTALAMFNQFGEATAATTSIAFEMGISPGNNGRGARPAWRAYHRGDFAAAVAEGAALGLIGANAANKAANIYATYLKIDGGRKREIFLQSAERAEALQAAAPDFVDAFYFHAQALGRYWQEISVVKALARGSAAR